MSGMFSNTDTFNQPLERWDVSGVKDMGGMFSNAKAFDQVLDAWDVSSVIDADMMFHGIDEDWCRFGMHRLPMLLDVWRMSPDLDGQVNTYGFRTVEIDTTLGTNRAA